MRISITSFTKITSLGWLGYILSISTLWSAESRNAAYDHLNRLTSIASDNGTIVSYTYDAAGNRLTRNVTTTRPPAVITWANPATIIYGTPLGVTHLNAIANVPGVFTYFPAAGTILPPGDDFLLLANFKPTNAAVNSPASASVTIDVRPPDSFEEWRQANFNPAELAVPGVSGPNVVLPGSTLTNLQRYAYGLTRRNELAVPGDNVAMIESGGQLHVHLTFRTLLNATDIHYGIWRSSDLKVWEEIVDGIQPSGTPAADLNGLTQTVTWRIKSYPAGVLPEREFFRMLPAFGAPEPVDPGPEPLFTDNFDRPDAASAGNGWQNSTEKIGHGWLDGAAVNGVLALTNGRVVNANGSGLAAIYRPPNLPTTSIRLSAVFSHKSGGGGSQHRHQHYMGIRSDGRIGNGYALSLQRSDNNYDNTQIILYDGQTAVASVNPSFQFAESFEAVARFGADGSVQVTVTSRQTPSNTFTHTFGPRSVSANGSNVIIGTEGSGGTIASTIDEIAIESQ